MKLISGPATTSSRPRVYKRLFPWAFGLMLLWIALATFPMPPEAPGHGLDASWRRALAMAHAQHLVFGNEIVFTFGPLGYLFYPVPGLMDPIPPFACVWAIYAVFLCGVVLIWRALGCQLTAVVSCIALACAMLAMPAPFERMQLGFLSFAAGITALSSFRDRAPTAAVALLGAAAGVMPLFKTNEGLAACAVFYLLLIGSRRRQLILAAVPPLVFVLAYTAVEHSVSSIGPYTWRSLLIAMGYSEGMSLAGPTYQTLAAVSGLLILIFLIPLAAASRRDLIIGLLPAIGAAFFAFKSGIVRQDQWHWPILPIKFAAIAILMLVCARRIRDRALLIAYVAGTFVFGVSEWRQASPEQVKLALNRVVLSNVSADFSDNLFCLSTWDQMKAENDQLLSTLQLDPQVSPVINGGTVDDIPNELDIVEGNGWRWKPRPVIQSYSAYTPELDQLNARHLASPDSADRVIMQFEEIDAKYPLLDDALSWRALFDHYDVALSRPNYLVLKRRVSGRYLPPRQIGAVTVPWKTDVDVPDPGRNEFIIMTAETGKTLYGIFRGLLFRNSFTFLRVSQASGATEWHRVNRANLVNGALITYLPWKLNEVAVYFGSGGSLPDRVRSLRFETPGPAEFSPDIRITWYAIAQRSFESSQ